MKGLEILVMSYKPRRAVFKLKSYRKSTMLAYEVAFKLVASTPWLNKTKYRDAVIRDLINTALYNQVEVYDIKVSDIGVVFKLEVNLDTNLRIVTNKLAFAIAKDLDVNYPELAFDKILHKMTPSRIWTHPYYIKSISARKIRDLDDYLK